MLHKTQNLHLLIPNVDIKPENWIKINLAYVFSVVFCVFFFGVFSRLKLSFAKTFYYVLVGNVNRRLPRRLYFIHNQKHSLIVMNVFKSFQNNWVGALLLKHVAGVAWLWNTWVLILQKNRPILLTKRGDSLARFSRSYFVEITHFES